ncbi:hypothetical protein [Streptomyces sp. Da 82-17]|uniref:hypothetical protein n=1 Tax=Streptomyces sp. Da 82-17 TaxID=3377116 RepID=UPI0038D4291D
MRRLLLLLLAWLFPARGARRRTAVAVAERPAPPRVRVRRSPYAEDAADDRTLYIDPPLWNTLRPYVHVHARPRLVPAEHRAQAQRRWALEMALRGRDVGPERIHGVRVGVEAA